MQFRRVCIWLVSLLLLVPPMRVSAQATPPAHNVQTGTVYLAFSLAKAETEPAEQVRCALYPPLLASCVGTGVSTGALYIGKDSVPTELWWDEPVKDQADLQSKLAAMEISARSAGTPLETWRSLLGQLSDRLPSQGPIQLWFISRYRPLQVKINAVTGLGEGKEADLAEEMRQMLQNHPNLTFHHVYTEAATVGQNAVLLDDYLRDNCEQAKKQWVTHQLNLDKLYAEETGEQSITALIRQAWQADVMCPINTAQPGDTQQQWVASMDYQPQQGAGDVLLRITSTRQANGAHVTLQASPTNPNADVTTTDPASATAPTDLAQAFACTPAPTQEEPDATLSPLPDAAMLDMPDIELETYESGGCTWAAARSLPAGSYQVKVTYDRAVTDGQTISVNAYYVVCGRSVWFADPSTAKPLEGEQVWTRDRYELLLMTDALDAPQSAYRVELMVDGKPVTVEPAVWADAPADCYAWQVPLTLPFAETAYSVQASLSLASPDMLSIGSEPLGVRIDNRLPELRDSSREPSVTFYSQIPGVNDGSAPNQKILRMSDYIADADGDALCFAWATDMLPDELAKNYRLKWGDDQLTITPMSSQDCQTELRFTATDGITSEQKEFALHLATYSVAEHVKTLRLRPCTDADEEQPVYTSANGQLAGRLFTEMPLVFTAATEDDKQVVEACRTVATQLHKEDVSELFSVQVDRFSADGVAQTAPRCELETQDGQFAVRVTLPATPCASIYELHFACTFMGMELPNLIDDVTLLITNMPPTLQKTVADTSLSADIDGDPTHREPVALSALLDAPLKLSECFVDEDQGTDLTYHVYLSTAGATLQTDADYTEEPDVAGDTRKLTLTSVNEDTQFDVVFADAGEYDVRIKAFDGENESADALSYHVRLTSSYTRMLIIIASATALALALAGILLAIYERNRPRFNQCSVCVRSLLDADKSDGSGRQVSLHAYQKRAVPLSVLLLAAQQPPLETLDMALLADIRLRPSRRGKAELVGGKLASKKKLRVYPSGNFLAAGEAVVVGTETIRILASDKQAIELRILMTDVGF